MTSSFQEIKGYVYLVLNYYELIVNMALFPNSVVAAVWFYTSKTPQTFFSTLPFTQILAPHLHMTLIRHFQTSNILQNIQENIYYFV